MCFRRSYITISIAVALCIYGCTSPMASIKHESFVKGENITIARDKWGVPHIFGKTDADVAYGLAWANAEDNFAVVQEFHLLGKGLYGKFKGEEGAMYDYALHAFRVKELVEERFEKDLSPEYRTCLAAYTQGLNDYAAKHPSEILLADLFPLSTKDVLQTYVVAAMQDQQVTPIVSKIFAGRNDTIDWNKRPFGKGSNGIAINKRLTDDGKTYLLINPHQPLQGMTSLYEAHLCSEEGLNYHGGSWHGLFGSLTFANPYLGVMTTTNQLDFVDVFQLEMNPQNPRQYRFDNEWLTLEEREIELPVKIWWFIVINVKQTVYWSRYGATFKNSKGYFSVRLGGNMSLRAAEQLYRVPKSRSFTEFSQWANQFITQNFVYADRSDTIHLLNNGLVPRRNEGYDWLKTVSGNTSQTLWTEFLTSRELPQYTNPKAGYLFNVNNSAFDATDSAENLSPKQFPSYLNDRTSENIRSVRFKELFKTMLPAISFEEFKQMKYDITLPQNSRAIRFLDDIQAMNPEQYPDVSVYIRQLKAWDRVCSAKSDAAATFLVLTWYFYSQKGLRNFYKENRFDERVYYDALLFVKKHFQKYFAKDVMSLGEIQRYERGTVSLPLSGYPDALAAMTVFPDDNGVFRTIVSGDGFVMFVRYSENGVEIETSNSFGASNHSDSPHYTDQMQMYIDRKTKTMSLDKAEVLKNAVKVYSPK